MKTYSVNDTLAHMRHIPESLKLEEVLVMASAAPVAVGVSWGLVKIFAKWLHVKYLIPMFFTSTTAGLAIWYSVQTFSPQAGESQINPNSIGPKKPASEMVMLNRENPLNSESLRSDTVKKKKKIIREERRIQHGDGSAPLPPLPELAPLPPVLPGGTAPESEVHEERRVVKRMKKEGKEEKEDKDAFIDAMIDHLEKAGLLKNREKFTLSLTKTQLMVDDKVAPSKYRDEVIELFHKNEQTKFGPGSSITINRDKKQWSISKSIESD